LDSPRKDLSPTHRLRRLSTVWAGHPFPRFFLTVCTAGRTRVLANEIFHERIRAFLISSPQLYGWHPLRYVVMPDHVHLLAATVERVTLGAWIKALKAVTANREFRWQDGFFDHVLRSGESESEKWEYVRQNPVRAGLIADPDWWPFAGELRFEYKSPGGGTRPTSGVL
jgi:putative transposase